MAVSYAPGGDTPISPTSAVPIECDAKVFPPRVVSEAWAEDYHLLTRKHGNRTSMASRGTSRFIRCQVTKSKKALFGTCAIAILAVGLIIGMVLGWAVPRIHPMGATVLDYLSGPGPLGVVDKATAAPVLKPKEIAQWVATDDYACTLYADGSIVSWILQDGQVAGRASIPQSPADPPRCAIAIGRDGSELACTYTANAASNDRRLDVFSIPALSTQGAQSLRIPIDGISERIAEFDYTNGRVSYEGFSQYIVGAFDLKTNQEFLEFKNPWRPTTQPMISQPPVFALPDFAGYIAVIDGKATAHGVKGDVLWSRPLPHPADYWNTPNRMQSFSRIFVIQDRDEQTAPIAAFDRRGGSPRWQSSVAKSGDIVATDDSGEQQLFVKDGKYSLLRLPDTGEVACQLSGDQDVQFTRDGKFLIALPSLTGGFVRSRASSSISIIDAKTGTLVRTVSVAEPN